jgi:two-component system response regulator WspF
VRLACEGDLVQAGQVLLAGSNDHLHFRSANRLGYIEEPCETPYRPSVDVLFESIRANWRGQVVAVLLTGMGRDGAQGLKALRDRGCHTIAQDQASSAVYGMPKAAAALGAASEVLPLDEIAAAVARALK